MRAIPGDGMADALLPDQQTHSHDEKHDQYQAPEERRIEAPLEDQAKERADEESGGSPCIAAENPGGEVPGGKVAEHHHHVDDQEESLQIALELLR